MLVTAFACINLFNVMVCQYLICTRYNKVTSAFAHGFIRCNIGAYTFLSTTGTRYLRPAPLVVQSIYMGDSSLTSTGIQMSASGVRSSYVAHPNTGFQNR